jgi:hypothetical protein
MMSTAFYPAYRGPSMNVTVTTDGHRVHRLADDRPFYGRVRPCVVRRDPMVAALFGATAAAPGVRKRAA